MIKNLYLFTNKFIFYALCMWILAITQGLAAGTTINLVLKYKTVYFAGKARQAITVNDQIPAPSLHFKEGEEVTINVYNCLNEEAAIHWHGILVPWQMDGVLGVSQHGIKPGEKFQYHFKLMQSGTYWYHAHAGLQEQQGLYGAFLIDPPTPPPYLYNKDYVIVLSDWSNTYPDRIMANLKKEGDYYSPRFPIQPSLLRFLQDYQNADAKEQKNLIDDYKSMQQMRMSIYDLSDVAYDAFLLNGRPNRNPWTTMVNKGDIVRLRFIGAAGDTIYRVKIPGTIMQMVHVQGNDVRPYLIDDFTIAPGETYDALVTISENKPYIIYAESRDKVGAAYGALITDPRQCVNYQDILPFAGPPPVTREMMANMMMSGDMKGNQHAMAMSMPTSKNREISSSTLKTSKNKPKNTTPSSNMNMSSPSHSVSHTMRKSSNAAAKVTPMSMQNMNTAMPTEATIIGDQVIPARLMRSNIPQTFGTKYQDLKAAVKTNDPQKPVDDIIKMELFGYMGRFIWFINGLTEYKTMPIILHPNKSYRMIFTYNKLMHHPMHIHGHWFILRNGHDDYDPLLHTIDIAPGATVTADIDTEASGQWFFHCHLLYHMVAGMSRVFQYSTLLELTQGDVTAQNILQQTAYKNRPIVRIDEERPINLSLVDHPMGHYPMFSFATWLNIGADPFNNIQKLTYKGLYGYDYNKLELFVNDAGISKGKIENADIDIFYWHLLSQFWAIKGGVNYYYRPANTPYWQPGIGIEGLMPYFIETNIRGYYHSGSAKIDIELSRDTQITNNFFIKLGIRSILASKTVTRNLIGAGLNQMRYVLSPYYRLMPGLNLVAEYEHEQDHGVFRNIQQKYGDAISVNSYTLGLSFLF